MLHTIPLGIVSSTAAAYLIEQSLLFDGASHLSRTPSTAGNRKTWTFSAWVKRGNFTASTILSAGADSSNYTRVNINGSDKVTINYVVGGSSIIQYVSTAVLRDTSSWYHIVASIDTTEATSTNRVKVWVNGTQITAWDTSTAPSQNTDTDVNSTDEHNLGRVIGGAYFDGLMALPQLIDGAALSATDFGETDDDGFWNPIEFTGDTTTDANYSATVTAPNFGTDAEAILGSDGDKTTIYDVQPGALASVATSGRIGIQMDFGSAVTVTMAAITAKITAGSGFRVEIYYSSDASTWTQFNSTYANLTSSYQDFATTGSQSARYWAAAFRAANHGSQTVTISDFRVFTDNGDSFGLNGGAYDFADTADFGKNVSGTDDQAALSSAAPAATAWLNLTSAWTMGSGTASRTSTVNAIRSASVFTGDFSLALTMASGANAARLGVYAANEDGTFVSSGADSAGLNSMTNSFYANFGAASFYKGSSSTASVSQTNGAITITRVSGTITINTAGGNHTFSATYTGPMRFAIGGGGATMFYTGIAYTADGQAGNSYFDTNFTTSDQLEDSPTSSSDDGIGNYITLNPNDRNNTSLVLTEGNTYLTASGDGGIKGTIFVDSGEHHFEYVAVSTTTNNMSVGVTLATSSLTNETPTTGDYAFNIRNGTEGGRAYDIFANGVTIATGSLPAAPNGKNIGVVFDADAGTLKFYNADLAASGDLIYTISSIPAGSYTVLARSSNNTHIFDFNFGQRPFVDTNLNNANAIATQNLPDTHPLYTGTAAQYRAGSQIMSLSYTGTSGAETNTCQRQEIDASIIADQAFTKVRVKFGAHTSEPFGIDNAYIGTKAGSGNAWDFAATPSTLKNNTNIAFDVPQSGTLWSDWVDFSGNGTTNLIVSFNVTSDAAKSDMLRGSGVSGVTRHAKNSSDEAADLAPTGFTSNATNVGSVLAIEVQ